ncbi:MAG: Tex family protein [Elusimicrobia bacterium]|nr:Tex family protein [Elusimicrobiota bacterium]
MDGALFVINSIQKDVEQSVDAVVNTVMLLESGATIPFIARYRKEKTGNLDETVVRKISDRLEFYKELEARKATIMKSIENQKKMTPDLKKRILDTTDATVLEDMYLPYKIKVKTRATAAKEKGLEGLADILLTQLASNTVVKDALVAPFVVVDKGVASYDEAIAGAQDIVAERIADNAAIRGWVRSYTADTGVLKSAPRKDFKDIKTKFSTYYETSELIKSAPSHRLLAVRRGTKEEVLSWKIVLDDDYITGRIQSSIIGDKNLLFKKEVLAAAADSYYRLMAVSIQAEVFVQAQQKAEEEAISVFSKNLRNLLLSPAAGSKITIGIDPGFRTGCKIAVVDEKGDFKEFSTIYPTPPENDTHGSAAVLLDLIAEYEPGLIAIGNGTASKETYGFVKELLRKNTLNIPVVMVSEAGASVYSASELAGKEYPDLDLTARGAISIAHRLQDPLAELVKIDPKAIGVGQYQHDVNQRELKRSLDLTVESCVNYVGVDLNTASVALLSYVSGIGPAIADNIVKYRSENGKFKSRSELKKIPKLGDKAFEQCAGFLRIRVAENPLDNSTIHPESYCVVEKMAQAMNVSVKELMGNQKIIDTLDPSSFVNAVFGLLTVKDIIAELKKPGTDPREQFSNVEFSTQINEISDVIAGMVLTGVVTNVTNFGAFVDIGVHQDGLVHISQLADTFIKNPYEVISVGDTLKVEVLEIEPALKRISLKRLSGGKAPDAKPSGGKARMPNKNVDQGFKIGSMFES